MSASPSAAPAAPPPRAALLAWLRALRPSPQAIDGRERWRIVLGVALGLGVTGTLCWAWGAPGAWLAAPMGASAVLIFGLPASPLAQPWAVVAGNTLSALAGLAWSQLAAGSGQGIALPVPLLAALAPATAVGLMIALRCLHPPGGASALLPVLAGLHDWRFALLPVLVNSLLLVSAGMAWNNATGRRYPHAAAPPPAPGALLHAEFTEADLDAVLARYNQVLDLPRDDLRELLAEAELQAQRRRLESLRCSAIMTPAVVTVGYATPLAEAWRLLRERHVKALPVTDRTGRLVGIVTLADFMRAADVDGHTDFDLRLRRLLRATPGTHSTKPEAAGQIMTRQVRVVGPERSLAELVPIFASTGHHHLPVVDAESRLLGIVTQSDVVAALQRSRA